MSGNREGRIASAAGWKTGAFGALCVTVAGLLSWGSRGLDVLSFDLPFVVRPGTPANEAVIIYLDEASARQLEQPWTNNMSWDRELHARLIRRLVRSHARAIVFDVLFDRTTPQDEALLEAVQVARAAHVPVMMGATWDSTQFEGKAKVFSAVTPFEALARLAGVGMVEQAVSKPRQHSPGFGALPSLAELVAQATGVQLSHDLLRERWINFYGPALALDHRSFAAALHPDRVPDSFFAGKVCFVGGRSDVPFPGGKATDERHTPYSRWGHGPSPGVEINATVYLNLARHEWLTRLAPPGELLLVLVAGVGFGLGLAWFRPTTATVLAGAGFLLVAAVGAWLMWQHHRWFSWLVVGAVQIPTALGWAVLSQTRRLSRENLALQRDLDRLSGTTPAPPPGAPQQPAPSPGRAAAGAAVVSVAAGASTGDEPTAPSPHEPATPPIPDHTLLRCIGKGAYGEVWLAQNVIGTCHAVKIVRRANFEDQAPFEREFRGIQKFMPISRLHPGLVQLLHAGRNIAGGFFYYIMEPADDATSGAAIEAATYCPKTLGSEIKRRGWLPVGECVHLALRLTDALEFLHSHDLIHRDIKPANIIFVRGEPKLADIGLVTDISTPTADASFVGTRGYIPPEGPGQAAADVFSLGRVLYEACMGLRCERFPQLPENLLERADHESLLELNQIILKACEENVDHRYRRAAEMHAELEQLKSRLGLG